MKPNKTMNGGATQNTQSTYYVDEELPRQILTTSNFWEENKLDVIFVSITPSPKDDIYHSHVLPPQNNSEKE